MTKDGVQVSKLVKIFLLNLINVNIWKEIRVQNVTWERIIFLMAAVVRKKHFGILLAKSVRRLISLLVQNLTTQIINVLNVILPKIFIYIKINAVLKIMFGRQINVFN